MSRIAVVGGGLAGLAAAMRLHAQHDVIVFEREAVAGGKLRSERHDGFVFDWGPNGFLSGAPEVRALAHEAGLDDELVSADPAATKRFVYWNGRLRALEPVPPRLLTTSLLSAPGKLRALAEPVVRPRPADPAESVAAFVARRFGREVAERIVAPALLGISGGDAAQTSVGAVFPRLVDYERDAGSVVRGLLRARRAPGRLTGFAGGMQRFAERLSEVLAPRVHAGRAVTAIVPQPGGWRVEAGDVRTDVDAVVLATPAGVAADLVTAFDPALAALLRDIHYAPMRVVGIAFRRADVRAPLDGFGFLAPRGTGVRSLGALFTSTIFPQHAPPDTVYLRVFVGGSTDRAAAELSVEALRAVVLSDLDRVLGIGGEPIAWHDAVWPAAIPQYDLGHLERVARIEERVAAAPGFALTGNAYRGLGVGDTVRDAFAAADRIG